jgi:hypothetical protein
MCIVSIDAPKDATFKAPNFLAEGQSLSAEQQAGMCPSELIPSFYRAIDLAFQSIDVLRWICISLILKISLLHLYLALL